MVSFQLLVVLVILGWIYFLWRRRRYYALMLKVPGPMGYPSIGTKPKDVLPLIEKLFRDYGKTFLWWLGPLPFYSMCDPQLVQEVLNSPHCVNKSSVFYSVIVELIGDGIMTSKDQKWRKHRKLLNPGFKQNVLLHFLTIFNNETKDFLELMDTYVGANKNNLHQDLMQLTLGIAAQTTMGTEIKEQPTFKIKSLMQNYGYLIKTTISIIVYPWLRSTSIRKLMGLYGPINDAKLNVTKSLSTIIDHNLKSSENLIKSPSLLSDYILPHLKNGNLTYKDALAECSTIVVAGFETTAGTIFHTLALLAMHPEYQDRLYEDLLELFPNPGNFEVTNEDIQKLDYLDRVIKESMRVISPGPVILRQTTGDVQLSNGIILPKGINVSISIFNLHRSEDIWGPEAKKFNPDNFLPVNIETKHPYSFLPFVKGIRSCIGWRYALMSSKVILAKLLRNYKFSTDFHFEDLRFVESLSIKLEESPLLKLEKRTK